MKKLLFISLSLQFVCGLSLQAGLFDSVSGLFGGSETTEVSPKEASRTDYQSVLSSLMTKLVDTSLENFISESKDISLPSAVSSFESVLATQGKSELYSEYKESAQAVVDKALPKITDFAKKHMSKLNAENAKELLDGSAPVLTDFIKDKSYTEVYTYAKSVMDKQVEKYDLKEQLESFVGEGTSSFLGSALGVKVPDVDISAYLTKQSLDQLYVKMADVEQEVRSNPEMWTELYQKYMESE